DAAGRVARLGVAGHRDAAHGWIRVLPCLARRSPDGSRPDPVHVDPAGELRPGQGDPLGRRRLPLQAVLSVLAVIGGRSPGTAIPALPTAGKPWADAGSAGTSLSGAEPAGPSPGHRAGI